MLWFPELIRYFATEGGGRGGGGGKCLQNPFPLEGKSQLGQECCLTVTTRQQGSSSPGGPAASIPIPPCPRFWDDGGSKPGGCFRQLFASERLWLAPFPPHPLLPMLNHLLLPSHLPLPFRRCGVPRYSPNKVLGELGAGRLPWQQWGRRFHPACFLPSASAQQTWRRTQPPCLL